MAHKGTLFLYEIGELNLELQAKLYQVFIDGTFERIGNSKLRKVDIRIIASSKHDLKELVKKGLFREDLYYSLNIYPIAIPPLRNRINDIPLLAEHYLQKYNQKIGKNVTRISKKAIGDMQRYSWPGNLQELENIIERAVIISKGSILSLEPFSDSSQDDDEDNLLSLDEHEKRYIIRILEKTYWRVEGPKGAAQTLNINHNTLRSRMRKLNIKRP
jgi:transcriptional regulator with GAF, ATPase, and Fis domain